MDVESVADATAEDAVKILQIISGLGVNGALVYCKFLSRQLVEQGHDVTILCRPNSWIASQTNEPFKVKTSALNRFPADLKKTAEWIRSQNFDVMHSHMMATSPHDSTDPSK